ncbi:nSTAND3 domain-containing NTPase [Micromonospora purpureochromogenes]|uniref:Energy-coupling factor transporter ATP-binding protein EcfA2 n=1 Tax=Micromonospora purpureochromogenes TaxID=47872 RepID=A0ABX2RJ72_9ACTN|nr:restriction endonuclease [Micromonospora purpureochromogenes]NYF56569.1 energy-coupling factor transporter ATP-binding protein EcfA2 [Micromonospora purpureochromogenes]
MADYDFRTLSPSDFEILIRDLLEAEHRWRLEAFGRGRDGGIDLRASTAEGKVVVQCKHYLGSTFSDLRSSARREVPKMVKEQPDRYLFVTSQDLNRTQKDTLAGDLQPWLSDTADLLTQIDINALITRHPTVEQQHFKLWLASTTILERIVQSGIWERSEALLEDIRDRVKLYVPTNSFKTAHELLDEKHVAVLTGSPGVGKSMLAEMLALRYWHEGWQIVSVGTDVDDAWDAYRSERKQVFLYDDFLGQTDLSERRAKDSWVVRFMDRVARNPDKRLVMTTRSQILQQTRLISEPIAHVDFRVVECVVKIADYGSIQRARMLYNHLYFSALSREVVREYATNSSYWQVVNHKNFSPRIIELVIKRNHSSADDLARALNHTLDRPLDLWGIIFNNGLSDLGQRITLTLASFSVYGASSDILKALVQKEAKPTEFTSALRVLEGTFVRVEKKDDGVTMVSYANPSVRDFTLAFLNEEPDYLLAIIRDAIHLAQVSTLLEYAVSEVDEKLRFPNCADTVTRQEVVITRKIMELVATEEEASRSESGQRLRIYQRTIKPLLDLLQPALRLMRNSFDEIFAVITALLKGPASGHMDPDDWKPFNLALITRHVEDPDQVRDELKWAFDSWGELLYTMDDVTAFEEFYETHGPLLQQQFDASTKFHESVESGLRQELENLSGNEQDRDSDHQWVDEVETAATRTGVYDDLRSDIESARDSIEQCYADDDYPHSRPTSGGGYGFPRPSVSAAERVEIEGMFRELS